MSSVRDVISAKGRKSKGDKLLIEAEMERLATKLASMPTPIPVSPEQQRKDLLMFAALGSSYNDKGYASWTERDFNQVGQALDAAGGRIQAILTKWDETANSIISQEEEDPLLAYASETSEERAIRYKRDAIIHESPVHAWQEAQKARNRYVLNQKRIKAGRKPVKERKARDLMLGQVYVTAGEVDPVVVAYELAGLGKPNTLREQESMKQDWHTYFGIQLAAKVVVYTAPKAAPGKRPLGGELTGLPF